MSKSLSGLQTAEFDEITVVDSLSIGGNGGTAPIPFIQSGVLKANVIDNSHLQDDTIDNSHLQDNCVGTVEIQDSAAVTSSKIANDAGA
eukprot:SAG22_NODE_13153_length_416_cov_2.347003_1_plen_89_part_00